MLIESALKESAPSQDDRDARRAESTDAHVASVEPSPYQPLSEEQALIVHIALDECEVTISDLEDELIEALEASEIGEVDGHELGPNYLTFYMYGPDAEAMWRSCRTVVSAWNLPKGSYVEIRYGDVGTQSRRITF